MKVWASSYMQRDAAGEIARRCAGAVGHALQALIRLGGTLALDAAERHLRTLDDRAFRASGLDPRDLPVRDRLARRSSPSRLMSNVGEAMTNWR